MPEPLKTAARIILTAALLVSPLGAQARPYLEPEGSAAPASTASAVAHNDAQHFGLSISGLTISAARDDLIGALAPYTYAGKSASAAAALAEEMSGEITRRGLRRLWQIHEAGQQVDAYYAGSADATVICVGEWAGGAHSQLVYVLAGRIGQGQPYPH